MREAAGPAPADAGGEPARRRSPGLGVSVPLLYAAFSVAWVGLSDLILATLPLSPGAQTTISMLKGFAFIAATTILLAVLLRRGLARERSARLRIEANEAMLRAITDTIPDPVFLKDRSSSFLFANPATLAAVGKPAGEVLGRRDTEIYADPAVGAALLETDRRIMDSGVAEVVEENIQTAAGYRVYLSTKAPFRDADGRVVGIVGNARDVTATRAADRLLREGEERLRLALDAARMGVWDWSLSSDEVVCSARTRALFGLPPAGGVSRTALLAAVHPDDRRRVEALAGGALSSDAEFAAEVRVLGPDGTERWISTSARSYRGADGRPTRLVGMALDVTDRKRAEEALASRRALEDQLAKVAESVPGAILSFRLRPDGSACMPFTTPAVEDVYGVDRAALARDIAPWAAHVHPDDLARVLAGVAAAARTMSRWHDEYRYLHPSKGLRWIEGWSVPQLESDGSVLWHGYVTDVTEQRRLEDQVQQAQRLDSIGRLAGGVAHDFNNLLTVILSCAEVLKDDLVAGGAPSVEDVEEIQAAGARARDLTRQLLAFARRQVIAPVPLDLNAVVAGSEKMLRRLLGEDIALEVALQPALWAVRCDAGQMEQILLNLAVNARDAMPRGGTLAIETSNVTREDHAEARAEVQAQAEARCEPGRWVRLTVRDSGVGMAPDVKSHVFEPFFTTKPSGEGTGLGLATVYGIVRQSEGHIHVDSAPGRGTTFEVCLPRTPEPPAALASRPAATAATGGSETVLVVEDDPQVRGVTVRALEAGGYRVLVASDGREALATGDAALRAVRLLVTDVVMPGMDGRALADALREAHPGIRVLFVSGYTQDRIAERGVLASGIEFLPKPFTAASLLSRVRAVLDA